MLYLILVLIVVVCLLLWGAILIQNPKGGGLSSQFGGGNVTNLIGAKQGVDFVEKATWTIGTIILLLVLLTSVYMPDRGAQEIESKVEDAAQSTPVPGPSNDLDPNIPAPTQEGLPNGINNPPTSDQE